MIKLQLIGHLGKDCTTNEVNGKTVINFPVAHTDKYNDKSGNPVENTIWTECSYWTDKTGIAAYLKKGQQVYVEGFPDVRTWESNGKNGASLTLRVITVQLLGSRTEQSNGDSNRPVASSEPSNRAAKPTATATATVKKPATKTIQPDEEPDDLPF